VDGRSGEYELFSAPPSTVEVPAVVTRQVAYTSRTGRRYGCSSPPRRPARRRGQPDRGPADRPLRLRRLRRPADPWLLANILAWAEAAGSTRGEPARRLGGGREWHRAGMLAHKQNVFDDFHAAAERLVADGWTTSNQLGDQRRLERRAAGRGALTQLAGVVRCGGLLGPLLDMVRYEKFGLGATWNVEYGSADDPEQLGWLLGTRRTTRWWRGRLSGHAFHRVRRRQPGRPATRPEALRGPAARHQRDRPILLRREKDVGHGARAMSRPSRSRRHPDLRRRPDRPDLRFPLSAPSPPFE